MKLNELTFRSGKVTEPLEDSATKALLEELDGFSVNDGALVRDYAFGDFAGALTFTNKVGELAEQYNHHPEIVLGYGKVTVKWWTHTAGGVTNNDFVLARETNRVFEEK